MKLFLGIFAAVILVVVLSAGIRVFSVFTERMIQVNSLQYKEGMQQRAAILRANIAEIDAMISTNPDNVNELMAQRRALSAQLNATFK